MIIETERKNVKILERNNQKRLAMYLEINTHCHIKKIAAEKNISITEWVRIAIAEKINKEIELGFNYEVKS